MAKKKKGVIGILTGGGDVPGLNPAIRAVTIRARREGYEVIGMMMRLWSEPGREAQNRCCTPESMGIARQVAGQLGIPFYAVNAQESFRNTVVEYFLDGYKSGLTPNPCLACNRHIRWEFLLERALALGADYMATGHYARVEHQAGEPVRLFEATDKHKDQSYVLSVLGQHQLKHALFPLGGFTKPEVRQIARELDVHIHRIGRTGRAGSKGIACTLYNERERYKFEALEKYLDQRIDTEPLPASDLLAQPAYYPPMVTLQIDGGKKQKVRPGDILGALTGEDGIAGKQVGKIHIFDNCAYVAVSQDAAKTALIKLDEGKLKGRSFRVRWIRS